MSAWGKRRGEQKRGGSARRRPSYADVTSTLALFLVIAGGSAFAATHYLITSPQQIKPSVLKALRGRTGATGPQGAPGSPGATGQRGAVGATGPSGADGISPLSVVGSVAANGGASLGPTGLFSVDKIGTGVYCVVPDSASVLAVGYDIVASAAYGDSSGAQIQVDPSASACTVAGDPNSQEIVTLNATGTQTDEAFVFSIAYGY